LNENDYASRVELKKLDENDPNQIGDNERLACPLPILSMPTGSSLFDHCLYDRIPSLKGQADQIFEICCSSNGPISWRDVFKRTGGMDKIDANAFCFSGRLPENRERHEYERCLENGLCRAFYDDDVVGTHLVCCSALLICPRASLPRPVLRKAPT
jgi:hypothetical protein